MVRDAEEMVAQAIDAAPDAAKSIQQALAQVYALPEAAAEAAPPPTKIKARPAAVELASLAEMPVTGAMEVAGQAMADMAAAIEDLATATEQASEAIEAMAEAQSTAAEAAEVGGSAADKNAAAAEAAAVVAKASELDAVVRGYWSQGRGNRARFQGYRVSKPVCTVCYVIWGTGGGGQLDRRPARHES